MSPSLSLLFSLSLDVLLLLAQEQRLLDLYTMQEQGPMFVCSFPHWTPETLFAQMLLSAAERTTGENKKNAPDRERFLRKQRDRWSLQAFGTRAEHLRIIIYS